MRNFSKAFLVFLCWAAIALFINGRNNDYDDTTTSNTTVEEPTQVKPKEEEIPSSTNITPEPEKIPPPTSKESDSEKTDNTIYPLDFKHKFITNSEHTRVLFPQNFYYFKDSIFNFLNHNPNKEIIITAKYLPSEKLGNGSTFGISRATYLVNQLIKYGVSVNRLTVKDTLAQYAYDKDGFFAEGISISYRSAENEKIKDLEQELSKKTLQDYFIGTSFKPDNSLLAYTWEIKHYLTKYPEKKITITGHTDNSQKSEISYSTGIKNAETIATYFEKNGLPKSKLIVQSKGDTEPLVENSNRTNRAKNRRIEIRIN